MTFTHIAAISVTCASLLSASVFAQNDYNINCDTNITSELAFANNKLMVKSTKQEDIVFTANGMVVVDGKTLTLSDEEKKLAQRYFTDIEASIPMVVDITVEALQITNMALTEVFKGLLGPQSQLPQTLSVRINDVSTAIKSHVYQDPNSLTFNSAYLKEDLGLGTELDEEIDKIKEEIITSVMGQVIMAIGKSMLSGDGNFADLEARMETLGTDIEKKAEVLAKGLEDKSNALCDNIKRLDATETQLSSIPQLQYLDTIQFNKRT